MYDKININKNIGDEIENDSRLKEIKKNHFFINGVTYF